MQSHCLDPSQLLVQVSGIWKLYIRSQFVNKTIDLFYMFNLHNDNTGFLVSESKSKQQKPSDLESHLLSTPLKKEGVAVTLFEAESSSGGKIKSFCEDGFIWEKGPNTMVKQFIYEHNPQEVYISFCLLLFTHLTYGLSDHR